MYLRFRRDTIGVVLQTRLENRSDNYVRSSLIPSTLKMNRMHFFLVIHLYIDFVIFSHDSFDSFLNFQFLVLEAAYPSICV